MGRAQEKKLVHSKWSYLMMNMVELQCSLEQVIILTLDHFSLSVGQCVLV